jgi:hypothetical protein
MTDPLKVARPPQDQVMLLHASTSDRSRELGAREAAGSRPGRAMYSPSWSGSITDPTHPVATGPRPVLAGAAPPVWPRRQLQ